MCSSVTVGSRGVRSGTLCYRPCCFQNHKKKPLTLLLVVVSSSGNSRCGVLCSDTTVFFYKPSNKLQIDEEGHVFVVSHIHRLLLLVHTFSALSLQLKKLRGHNKSAIDLSNANPARGEQGVRIVVANQEKLLYTVANLACDLLNRKKKKKK